MTAKSKLIKSSLTRKAMPSNALDRESPEWTKETFEQATLMRGDAVIRGPKKDAASYARRATNVPVG
jgi:hypothetical protein